jgi:hypothetical protein
MKALDLPNPPKRRATTPEPSPSYRLLIFPPEQIQQQASPLKHQVSTLHRPRPLRRSNTAPGALSPGLKDKHSTDEATPLSPMSETDELLALEEKDEDDRQALTPTPSEPSTPTTPSDGRHSVHSFNPFTNDRGSAAWNSSLDVEEPSWEMITIGKLAEPGDRVSGQVRVEGTDDHHHQEDDWHHHHGGNVKVSIARSVSVTKARRQIVGPTARPFVRSSASTPKLGGRNERLIDRKPLTPTLVELVDVPGKNRKSVRGIVEGFE